MASLTGQTIQSTYDALLKISGNDALTSSLQRITDGLGNFTPLYLSTTAVEISSGLNVIGSITGSNLSGTNTGDETTSSIKTKLGAASSSQDGYLTSTDWSTFNAKQNALGYTPVPNTRSLTINGTAYDLSADRSWIVGSVVSVGTSGPLTGGTITTSGTIGITQATTSTDGYLSSTDWNTFNNKQNALTLTTTGSSGSATLVGSTLNIPTYTLTGLGGVPTTRTLTINGTAYDLSADRSWIISTGISGTGTTNYLPKFTGSTSVGNSLVYDNGTNVGIGTTSPTGELHISGSQPALRIQSTVSGNMQFGQWDTTYNRIQGSGRDFLLINTDATNMLFSTNNTERMRITSGGNVGIGTTSPASLLNVAGGNVTVSAGYGIAWAGDQTRIMTPEDNVSGALIRYGSGGIMRFVNGSTEHMRINGSGNVGIGTTSPSSLLEIAGSAPVLTMNRTSGSFTNTINFNAGSNYASIISNAGTGEQRYSIGPSAGWGGFHTFYTDNTERMRITSGGNVGIGTTPSSWGTLRAIEMPYGTSLSAHSSFPLAYLNSNAYYNGSNWIYNSNWFAAQYIQDSTEGTHKWFTAASGTAGNTVSFTERMRITSSGNVGIGTTSPQARLHSNSDILTGYFQNGTNGIYDALKLTNNTASNTLSGNGARIQFYNNANNGTTLVGSSIRSVNVDYGWASDLVLSSVQNNGYSSQTVNDAIWIKNTGNVGIGTTSPDKKLHVSGSDTVLRIQSGTGGVYMQMDSGASSSYIGQLGTSMYFENGGTERMRITSAGNVGVNTTSPSYKLDVNGDIRSTGAIRVNTGTIDTVLTFDTSAGAVGTVTNHNLNFWINGTTQAKITTDAQLYVGTGVVNASAKVQIDSTTKGFLPPRMTSLQRIAISSPAVGLMVYQTDNAGGLGGNEGLYIYKSGGWTFII